MTSQVTEPTTQNNNKNLTQVIYALYALSIFTGGLAAIIAVIINYVKKVDVEGTYLETHFRWQIRTFWFGLIWAVIGLITSIAGVGLVVLGIAAIWIIYRVIKGWIYLNDNKPMYSEAPKPQPSITR